MRDRRGNLASSNAEALGVERNGHLEVFFFFNCDTERMASLLGRICLGKPGKQYCKSGPMQGGCAGIEVLDPLWPPYWKAPQISNDSRRG